MEQSRTINSFRNSISSVITYLVLTLSAFVSQTFFIKILGNEFLGLNSLFSNILSMLSLFELGIGSAIVYNLYKPIAENDKEKIKSLLVFYKKAYNILMLSILGLGLIVLPFIPKIVSTEIDINTSIAFLLMLISTVVSYFLTYKRSIIYASQKEYIINIVHSIYLIILNIIQILILIYIKNYYLYLIVKIVCQLIENIILSILCNHFYPFIMEKSQKLDRNTEFTIFKKVKAMIYHKVGGILVFSTDSLIINKFLGLAMVGINSNYNLIINSINNLVCKFIESLIPSVGNLLVQNDNNKAYEVFKKIRFINFWISTFTSVCLVLLLNPFISLWLGDKYLMGLPIVIVLIISYYQKSERYVYSTFKNSAGIWEQDKHVPILEALLNLFISIILANYLGIIGVYLGTVCSGLIVWIYGYPKYIYMYLFKKSYLQYIKESLKQLVIFCIIMVTSLFISKLLYINTPILNLILNMIIGIIIPNVILIFIYHNDNNYIYVKKMLLNILKKVKL